LTARLLATLGLVLTIIGALLLFKFGLPVDVDPKGAVHIILEQPDLAEIAKAKSYLRLGRLGISLIIIGSGLQIAAVWVA